MNTLGIILAGGDNKGRLGDLINNRAAAALPIGSSYRAIDFSLSNMSNSGIGKVAVLTQYNSRSLTDHLSSAKWWNFGRKKGGLFLFTPYISNTNAHWFRGTADSIYQNMSFLERSNDEFVVLTSGDSIYKMDYRKLVEHHMAVNADITVVYKHMPKEELSKFGVMELSQEGRMIGFQEKPEDPKSDTASLGIYVIRRTLLMQLLNEVVPQGKYNFVEDIVVAKKDHLNICGYEFTEYWSTISSGIQSYYKTNMEFLKPDIRDLFTKQYPFIETKAKDEAPAKYNRGSHVKNCVVGNGGIFNGTIENSVIFRKVFADEHSVIRDSIIMEGCHIGKGCIIEYAILDKEVVVSDGKTIRGESAENPIIIKKKSHI